MKSLLIFLISANCWAAPSQDAVNAAARALYEQQHWNDEVNNFLKSYEHKLSPQEKIIGGYIYQILKIISDQEVTLTWRFP
jgi:hypothetical protein